VPGRTKDQKKVEIMNTRKKYPRLTLLLAGTMAILASGIAIGSLAFSAPQHSLLSAFTAGPPAIAKSDKSGMRAQRLCSGCGVIQSTRNVGGIDAAGVNAESTNSAGLVSKRGREITVLLQDGSTRVITDANPAKWKHGERVTIIAGIDG